MNIRKNYEIYESWPLDDYFAKDMTDPLVTFMNYTFTNIQSVENFENFHSIGQPAIKEETIYNYTFEDVATQISLTPDNKYILVLGSAELTIYPVLHDPSNKGPKLFIANGIIDTKSIWSNCSSIGSMTTENKKLIVLFITIASELKYSLLNNDILGEAKLLAQINPQVDRLDKIGVIGNYVFLPDHSNLIKSFYFNQETESFEEVVGVSNFAETSNLTRIIGFAKRDYAKDELWVYDSKSMELFGHYIDLYANKTFSLTSKAHIVFPGEIHNFFISPRSHYTERTVITSEKTEYSHLVQMRIYSQVGEEWKEIEGNYYEALHMKGISFGEGYYARVNTDVYQLTPITLEYGAKFTGTFSARGALDLQFFRTPFGTNQFYVLLYSRSIEIKEIHIEPGELRCKAEEKVDKPRSFDIIGYSPMCTNKYTTVDRNPNNSCYITRHFYLNLEGKGAKHEHGEDKGLEHNNGGEQEVNKGLVGGVVALGLLFLGLTATTIFLWRRYVRTNERIKQYQETQKSRPEQANVTTIELRATTMEGGTTNPQPVLD